MPYSSPGEPDYAFGQAMLTLRDTLGLTQAALAQHLGISRHAVGAWETGIKYPSAAHLKHLITLAVAQQAFTPGREAHEIYALWRAAHQKVLLNEAWLDALLRPDHPSAAPSPPAAPAQQVAPPASGGRVDWGEAPAVPAFYGREWEASLLTEWLVADRCRVVSVLGLGGIGKSALAVTLMHQLAAQFEVVIWRSVRDAPACETLLESCLQVLAPAALGQGPTTLDAQLNLVLDHLRRHRVLLVLDNLESVLAEGAASGQLRPGYDGYGRLLRRVGESDHQSCLLVTSREKPSALLAQEGSEGPARTLRLSRLAPAACARLLADRQVRGTVAEQARLIDAYAGNPLALQIVAQTVVDLFAAEIGPFLAQGAVIYGGVREVLDGQFARLSPLEQSVLRWLAILREPATLADLAAVLVTPVPQAALLETLEALYHRSLLERGQVPGSFTLQSVVLEYVTARLITDAGEEIQAGTLVHLREHALVLAHGREYVRQTQERLLVAPILAQLLGAYPQPAGVAARLRALLDALRSEAVPAQGYGPANLLALLRQQQGDLRGLDLSALALRGVDLQGVEMQDASLAGALIRDSLFTEAFDIITSVAISDNGAYWAATSGRGEVRVWAAGGHALHRVWWDPTAIVWRLALSPDGLVVAGGAGNGEIKLWDIASAALLWSAGRHASKVNSLAFAPAGHLLASCGSDGTVRLWDRHSGKLRQTLSHPAAIPVIAWSPDGQLLASGDAVGGIRLWSVNNATLRGAAGTCVQTFTADTQPVMGLAFAPDGRTLASAGRDGTVRLWDLATGQVRETPAGERAQGGRVAWSPDGRTLAIVGGDEAIWLWEVAQGRYRAVLRGHTAIVLGLAFTPDSRSLLSGSQDGTLRVWEVAGGHCTRVMHGYATSLNDVDWSPDGRRLVSSGWDRQVTIYDVTGAVAPYIVRKHRATLLGVAWSPDGRTLAEVEWGNDIQLWNPDSGARLQVLQHPDDPENRFATGVSWSPDGQWLAAGTGSHGVLVWNRATQALRWPAQPAPARPDSLVVWSPDGRTLANGGADGGVYILDAATGTMLHRLVGHHSTVASVAWSPDGRLLASGSSGSEGGELFVWEVAGGQRVQTVTGPPGTVLTVAWGAGGDQVISGGLDGRLRWWDVASGECLQVRDAHMGQITALRGSPDGGTLASCGYDGAIRLWDRRSGELRQTLRRDRPYERLNINGIQGLTAAQQATLRALGAIEDAPAPGSQG